MKNLCSILLTGCFYFQKYTVQVCCLNFVPFNINIRAIWNTILGPKFRLLS